MSSIPSPAEYLHEGFDAASLKVAQLRGLLLEYNVPYPASSKKADLVTLFEEHIKPRASDILASARGVEPSNSGIISVANDGTESVASTGKKRGRGRPRQTISTNDEAGPDGFHGDMVEVAPEPPVKRSRGRPSRLPEPVEEKKEEKEVGEPAPAAKSTSRGSRRKSEAPKEDVEVVIEVKQATPIAPTRRGRASLPTPSPGLSLSSAPSSARRRSIQPSSVSVASEIPGSEPSSEKKSSRRKTEPVVEVLEHVKEEDEVKVEDKSALKTPKRHTDTAFTDFNPFQSGSQDAAERERRRRKSSIGLSAKKPSQPRFSEPAPTPDEKSRPITPPTLRRVGPSRENLKTPPKAIRDAVLAEKEQYDQATAAEQYNAAIQEKLNQLDTHEDERTQVAIRHSPVESKTLMRRVADTQIAPLSSPRSSIPLGALFLLLLSFIANYKSQSASLGFCDSGSTVNDIVLNRQSALDNANACIARRIAVDLDTPGAGSAIQCDVSALPLVPFIPRPEACAPCPQHAVCEDGQLVACEPEYILSENPLAILSPAFDGVPGLGPRAFQPSCRPDTAKKRMIGGLAKSIEADLARGRGQVICAGLGAEDGRKGQGERFGVEESALRETYASRRDPKFSREQFDEIFEAALKDLVEHDDVIESIDVDGRSWYAAARTDMTLACSAKLRAVDTLEEWKSQLASTAVVLAGIAYIRTTLKHRQQEKYRAEELVPVVLKRLQDQERLHYSDPVTTPNPFIPITQLRDLVMPPKGSTTSRTRLWQRVQDLVEANANVAVREQEVHGELWKTWQWQGVGERHVTWDE